MFPILGYRLLPCIFHLLHRNGKLYRRLSGIRQCEMFLQGVGGKFLAHTGAVQDASRAVVDESGAVDMTVLRMAKNSVNAFGYVFSKAASTVRLVMPASFLSLIACLECVNFLCTAS